MKAVYLVVGGVAVAGAGVGAYFLLRKPAAPPPPAVQPGGGGSLCSKVATVAVQAGVAAGASSQGVPPGAVPPGVAPLAADGLCAVGSAVVKIGLKVATAVAGSVSDVGSGVKGLFVDNYVSCEDLAARAGLTGSAAAASVTTCKRNRELSKSLAAPGIGTASKPPTTVSKVGGVPIPRAPLFG